jgi:hypothetical protein
MNRRKFLKIAGSGAAIVAASGGGFVATRTPKDALVPWIIDGSQYPDPMRQALSYAILAPNPHNRQPWVIDLKSDTEAVLTCDLDRLLPATDPFNRQIVIGLGCFLELFSLAATQNGYVADIEYFVQGESPTYLDQRPIANLMLRKQSDAMPDPLFAQVLNRHTNRNPYDTSRAIPEDVFTRLKRAAPTTVHVGTTGSGDQLNGLRVLTRDAMVSEVMTPEAYQESIELMRIGRTEIEANPDGISLGGAFLETLNLFGVLTRENLADPTSSSYQIGLDMIDEGAMSSMGFVWVNTQDNDRAAQIDAGRAYMRIALQAAADGIAMQPMSQALQEYVEMASYYEVAHKRLTNHPGERIQMLARLGYAIQDVGPSPRWALETRIKEQSS